jgi:hypothetical protein
MEYSSTKTLLTPGKGAKVADWAAWLLDLHLGEFSPAAGAAFG